MTRKIKYYDGLSAVWRKQILQDLKVNALSVLDVAINQSKKKAVLVNSSDEEWLVILNFSPTFEDDDEDYSNEEDYNEETGSDSFSDDIEQEED